MDNKMGTPEGFDLSPEILDEIQSNIEEIIKSFPISETNKMDVIKKSISCTRRQNICQ